MSDQDELESELKKFLIRTLALEDISEADIASDLPLFGEGLGLDSVDALELGVAIYKTYGVTIAPDTDDNRHHFANIRNLAGFIAGAQKEGGS